MQLVLLVAGCHQQLGVTERRALGKGLVGGPVPPVVADGVVVPQLLDDDNRAHHGDDGSNGDSHGPLVPAYPERQLLDERRPRRRRRRRAEAEAAGGGGTPSSSRRTFSKMLPSGERMKSTGVDHSSRNSASSALRALLTAWSTGSPSTRAP